MPSFLAGFVSSLAANGRGDGIGRIERLTLFLILVVTFLVYQPGMYGDYVFDDLANITYNKKLVVENGGWQEWAAASTSSFSGLLKRPVSMLTFAVNASTTGLEAPLYFKLTNLFIHLANGLLVFWLARLLLRRAFVLQPAGLSHTVLAWTSLLVTALWMLHPLNLTSVLYIVQRMTSLAAMFSFLAIGLYVIGRTHLVDADRRGWWWIAAGLIGAGSLALLSKENGVLIPLLMLVVEITLFRFETGRPWDRRLLIWFFALAVAIPAALFLGATAIQHPGLYSSYKLRDFDMTERSLTEARVLWFYLRLALLPSMHSLALYHDDFPLSHSLLDPLDTLPAILGLIALLAVGAATARKMPLLAFGIFWFFAGHALESTTLPLEVVHEHRNYLPLFGPLLAAAYYFCLVGGSPQSARIRRVALVFFCAILAGVTLLRSQQWGNSVLFSIEEAQNHPGSERANQQLGRTYVILYAEGENPQYAKGAEEAYRQAIRASPTGVLPLLSLLQLQMRLKLPHEPALVDQLVYRLGSKPQAPSVIAAMRTLIDCQMFAYCTFTDTDIDRIFDAALRNPKAQPVITGNLRLFLAQYEVDKRGNLAKGAKLIQDALKDSPGSVDLHLNMARVYRLVHAFDFAERHLAEARRLNAYGYLSTDIAEEGEKLARDRKMYPGITVN